MKRPASYEEGMELISKLLDDSISDQEFARLHTLLEADADLRKVYLQTIDQEVELMCLEAATSHTRRFFGRRLLGALAALIVAALTTILVWKAPWKQTEPSVAKTPVRQPSGPRPVPAAPEIWLVNFEGGIPTGWSADFTADNLPAGSRGAARMRIRPNDPAWGPGFLREIAPPIAWGTGYFRLPTNAHLHFTFKLEKADWFNIFLLTQAPQPDRPESMMYLFSDGRLWLQEDTWMRATVPLSHFKGKDPATDQFVDFLAPREGEVAYRLFFSAFENQTQLVIDEIRVDGEGPGEVVIEALP